MDALSLAFEQHGRRGDRYAALRMLQSAEVRGRLEERILAQVGRLPGSGASSVEELTERAVRRAMDRAADFRAQDAPDFPLWVLGLLRGEIEERWFLGMERRVALELRRRGVGTGDTLLEEVAVWSVSRAIHCADRFDPARGDLEAWVLGIARRRLSSVARLRRNQRQEATLELLGEAHPGVARVDVRDLRGFLYSSLVGCPRNERFVLRARVQGIAYPDIAARLELGVPSVHNLMSRVRRRLRQTLERTEPT